ncbi:uncharacterized protein [Gossypium hirsutum]|uniref:Uncharacterized protein n=1 Tax=Gossypium hirsutum TaxID=3635 RepID=A0A1U8JKI5_GOSHI|nr:uncharacterized protein LOC107908021 [Gossypium hirsutum]
MMYRGKLASSELFTILGGFISSFLFLVSLTFIGNFQEAFGMRTGWGAGSFLFSAGLLCEVNKISGVILSKSEPK